MDSDEKNTEELAEHLIQMEFRIHKQSMEKEKASKTKKYNEDVQKKRFRK